MDKILRINEDYVLDLSKVESIYRNKQLNTIELRTHSGILYFKEGELEYADIVNRWARLIEEEKK